MKTKRLRIINREKGSKPESDAQVPTGNSAPVVVSDYYEPFPRQNEFHLSKAKYRLFGGAAGPGKQRRCFGKRFDRPLAFPGVDTLLLRRTFPELESSLLAYFRRDVPRRSVRELQRQQAHGHLV